MIKESWNLIGQEAHLATPYFNDYLYAQNPTGSFPRYCWSKNPAIWLDERQNWSHLTEVSSLRWYHFLMTNFLQKKKTLSIDSFQWNYWSKNSPIWLNERLNWPNPSKNRSLRCYLRLMIIFMQKIQDINWFLSDILIIKEYCNLPGQETQLATHTEQW